MRKHLPILKAAFLFSLIACLCQASFAQVTLHSNGSSGALTVSGTQVVNTYHHVTYINGNQITYNGAGSFAVGDKVLIIQMTGPSAGDWQWDTVKIAGNPLTVSGIYRSFDPVFAKVQLVKVPQYSSLHITSTGKLTAAGWNDSIGGILTFMVRDTFKVDSLGRCDVTGLGFKPTSGGTNGIGGVGGAGGAAGPIGQNGGSVGLVVNSGLGGGGDGGLQGSPPTAGALASVLYCPGCGQASHNVSNLSPTLFNTIILMGGAGDGGNGGGGGIGAGGGGGGANGAGIGQNGGNGGSGGNGGIGGNGGYGAGIILFTANYLKIPAGDVPFQANGLSATNGTAGTAGAAGGNGGLGGGLTCLTGGGGGGGGGANGGDGGSGGNGGNGGIVLPVLFHACPAYTSASYQVAGGARGLAGAGGAGGLGGISAGIIGYSCGGGGGIPPAASNDTCSAKIALNALHALGVAGNSTLTVSGTSYIYANATDTVWVDRVDAFTVLVYTLLNGHVFYTVVEDTTHFADPFPTVDSIFAGNNAHYDTTTSGRVYLGTDTFPATCDQLFRNFSPSGQSGVPGNNGNPGGSGSNGGGGGSGGGGIVVIPDCSSNPITIGGTTQYTGDGCPYSLDPNSLNISGGNGSYTINYTAIGGGCSLGSYDATYTVAVTDTANCNAIFTVDVISQPDIFALSPVSQTPTTCPNSSDGTFSYDIVDNFILACYPSWALSISGPNGFFFNDNGSSGSSNTLTGLAVGTYLYSISSGSCSSQTDQGSFTILPSGITPSGDEYDTICDGASFTWIDGITYTQSGTASYTIPGGSAAGCDSLANLNLTVLTPITAGNLSTQFVGDNCGASLDVIAMNITGGDGNYSLNFTSGLGTCSMGGLDVPYTVDVLDGHNCFAEFYTDVNYVDDVFDITNFSSTPASCTNGADGTLTYQVIDYTNQECNPSWNLSISGPNGYSNTNSGNGVGLFTFTGLYAGSYTYSIVGSDQCSTPSSGTFTINSQNIPLYGNEYDTICDGASFTWIDGNTYTQAGTASYTYTAGSVGGCDSTTTLNLTVSAPITAGNLITQNYGDGCGTFDPNALAISGGDGNYTFNTLPSSGICIPAGNDQSYSVTVTDGHGCTAQLSADAVYADDAFSLQTTGQTNTSCPNASDALYHFMINNTTNQACQYSWSYTISGPGGYLYTFAANGSGAGTTSQTLTGLAAGTYSYQVSSGTQCPVATDNGNFTIIASNSPLSGYENDTICHGASFLWNGNTYTHSGTYIDTLLGGSVGGCDSIAYLSLTILPSFTSDVYDTLSSGHSITVAGNTYTQSGVYTIPLTTSSGCDSTITLYLLVEDSTTFAHLFDTICQGFSVTLNGHSYTVSGTYLDTIRGTIGPDTVITLNLTVRQALLVNVYDTICQGSSVTAGGHTYTQSGLYVDTLTSRLGCDSVRALHLWVTQGTPPSVSITVSHGPVVGNMETDTFTAIYTSCNNPYYSWYRNIVPFGVHMPVLVFTHLVSDYDSILCRVDCNGPCGTSPYAYSNPITIGISDLPSFIEGIRIYPNPNQGDFYIDITTSVTTDRTATISIFNAIGQNILKRGKTLHSGENKELIALDENTPSGIYIAQLTIEGQSVFYRIVLDK